MGEHHFDMWSRAGREIERSFVAEGSPAAALEALDVPCPTLHLYAQPAAPEVLAAQQEYAAAHPWFAVERLDARSHFPTFEVPDAVAAAVTRFAARLS
jgi:pimeloyl-ACP methyl ester carboxylesterase